MPALAHPRRFRLTWLTWSVAVLLVFLAVCPVTAPFASLDLAELTGTASGHASDSSVKEEVLVAGASIAEIVERLDVESIPGSSDSPFLTHRVTREVVLRV